MNCPTIDKLTQYVDELLMEQEFTFIKNHVKDCEDCRRIIEAFVEEERFMMETLQTPTLPDTFSATVLEKLEPYETKNRRKKKILKPFIVTAAAAVLTLGLTATLNPSFAEWVGGLFQTEQVDEGLRMAADAGIADRVNLEVEDQGITFKVEDVVADSSRVALSYQILNQDGKPQDTYIEMMDKENEVIAVNQDGKKIDRLGMGWQEDSDYGFFEISLREQQELEKLIIKFNLKELDGTKGNWELDVPVNLKKGQQSTTVITLDDAKTSQYGVALNMSEIRYSTSSTDLFYETFFTKEEQKVVEAEIEKFEGKFGKEVVRESSNYGTAIRYHIEDETGKAMYYSNPSVYEYQSSTGFLESTSMDTEKVGLVKWNESYLPQKNNQNLTFVLDGFYKTVPTDFSIKVNLKDLKKEPITFEYEGNFMTIKKAKKHSEYSFFPMDKETYFKVKMDGGREKSATELGEWILVDNQGKAYSTFKNESLLFEEDKNGRYKLKTELAIYDLKEVPEEFTLHLISATRYKESEEKWKLPLY